MSARRARGCYQDVVHRGIAVSMAAAAIACGARSGVEVLAFDAGVAPPIDAAARLDGGADAADPDAGAPCEMHVVLEHAHPEVVLVLDRSGSMDRPLASSSVSRTVALRAALAETLPALGDEIAFGAVLYPVAGADPSAGTVCALSPMRLDVGVRRNSASAVLAALDAHPPAGGTPTADALERAYDALRRDGPFAPAVVLATDGGPNCNPADAGAEWYGIAPESCIGSWDVDLCLDDERTVAIIEAARATGIPTYVIGMDVTLPIMVATLDAMAVAGGRPLDGARRFYDAARPERVEDALRTIATEVSECAFVGPAAIDPSRGTVHVDGEPVEEWGLGPGGSVELAGDACARANRPGAIVTFGPPCDR